MNSVVIDKKSFATAFISVVVVMVVSGIISPHISIKALEHNGLLWVSFLTLGFMLARSYSSLLHARLYESYSARITGVIGLGLLMASYSLYMYVSPTYYPLVKLLEGFSAGLFWPLMQTLIVSGVDPGWRSRWLSIYFLVGNLAGFAGYQLGSLIIVLFGKDKLLLTGIMIGLLYLLMYPLISPGKRINWKTKRRVLTMKTFIEETRNLKSLIPLIVLVGGVNGLMKDYVFAYTKIITGYSEEVLRNLWSLAGYIGLIASIGFAHLQESLNKTRFVLLINTLFTASIVIIIFTNNPVVVFSSLALTIIGTRTLRPIIRGLASNKASSPEIGIAIVNSLSNIIAGVFPVLVAVIQFII